MRRVPVTVVDTGLHSAEANLAMDRAWLVGHAAGERPSLLRFHRSPASLWIGLHQWPEQELRLLACHTKGVEVVRRLTGGGTLYVDEHQLGFSLVLKWSDKLAGQGETEILAQGCEALVSALGQLGVAATFKAPNDVEVDGRKLASLFLSRHRSSILIQGFLLLTAAAARLQPLLRLATEPRSGAAPATASERVTGLDAACETPPTPARLRKVLTEALAKAFNLRAQASTKTVYAALREPDGRADWPAGLDHALKVPTATAHWRDWSTRHTNMAEALWHSPAGLLRARLHWDSLRHAPRDLELGGDVQCFPLDLFERLGTGLAGVALADLEARLDQLCDQLHARLVGFTRADLLGLLHRVYDRAEQQRRFGLRIEQANRLLETDSSEPLPQLVARADTVILPYCARPPECRTKPLSECRDCSKCEVGAACRIADTQGMTVRESGSLQQLDSLLNELADSGSRGVLGMTCQTFFIKHRDLFQRAGLPLVVMEIGGTTCYDRQQEAAGYAGLYPRKTTLDIPLLEKLAEFRDRAENDAEGGGMPVAV